MYETIEFNSPTKGLTKLKITIPIVGKNVILKCCFKNSNEIVEKNFNFDATNKSHCIENVVLSFIDEFQDLDLDDFDDWWAKEDGMELLDNIRNFEAVWLEEFMWKRI
jgi:hypothetical protein